MSGRQTGQHSAAQNPSMDTYTLTLDDLVAFAQEGWHYPLADDQKTRDEIRRWLTERGITEREA